MFRRFGILVEINGKVEKKEVILNLNHITSIEEHNDGTFIYMQQTDKGLFLHYKSEIEYEHLANALDGIKF